MTNWTQNLASFISIFLGLNGLLAAPKNTISKQQQQKTRDGMKEIDKNVLKNVSSICKYFRILKGMNRKKKWNEV